MAFVFKALRIGKDAVAEPDDAVGEHHGGQLAAGEDVVADGDLFVHDAL